MIRRSRIIMPDAAFEWSRVFAEAARRAPRPGDVAAFVLAFLILAAGPAAAQAPSKPTGFTATGTSSGADLAWTDPSDSSITSWEYRQKNWGASTWGSWTSIPNSGATTVSYSLTTGLTDGRGYTFQIRAVNSVGNGTASDEKTALVNGCGSTMAF